MVLSGVPKSGTSMRVKLQHDPKFFVFCFYQISLPSFPFQVPPKHVQTFPLCPPCLPTLSPEFSEVLPSRSALASTAAASSTSSGHLCSLWCASICFPSSKYLLKPPVPWRFPSHSFSKGTLRNKSFSGISVTSQTFCNQQLKMLKKISSFNEKIKQLGQTEAEDKVQNDFAVEE